MKTSLIILDSLILKASKCQPVPVSCLFQKDNKCGVNAEQMRCECTLRCCSTLTWCILGCGCVPVVAHRVLRRQVKGARWQNAWCVACFLGFDLPRIHSFEENEDELQQRGHPLACQRTYQQMDKKSVCLTLLFRLPLSLPRVPFYFFLHFAQFHSNESVWGQLKVRKEVLDKQLIVTTDHWQTKQRKMDYTFNTKQRKVSSNLEKKWECYIIIF